MSVLIALTNVIIMLSAQTHLEASPANASGVMKEMESLVLVRSHKLVKNRTSCVDLSL